MFIAPNQTGIMNSLPANQRGAGAGMAGTFNCVGPGALHRHLLHPDDPRAGLHAAVGALPRPHRPGGEPGGGDAGVAPAPGRQPLRRLPGLQPDAGRSRATPTLSHLPHSTARLPDQPPVLPAPHRPRLLQGADRGLLLRRRRVPARCRGVAAPGRQVPLRGGRDGRTDAGRSTGCRPRRRWPRPSRCWWTEMAVSTRRTAAQSVRPASEGADARASASATPPPGPASRPAPCATTRSSAC